MDINTKQEMLKSVAHRNHQRILEDELKHHGILGMKWGIRRYQPYPDGTKRKGKHADKGRTVKPNTKKTQNEQSQKMSQRQEKQAKKIATKLVTKLAVYENKILEKHIGKEKLRQLRGDAHRDKQNGPKLAMAMAKAYNAEVKNSTLPKGISIKYDASNFTYYDGEYTMEPIVTYNGKKI